MLDPEFSPGSEHTAHALMTNNTPKEWTYNAELSLVKGGTTYTSSGTITFSLAAGASQTINLPITMPIAEGTYQVFLDIYVAGELIAAYLAIEDITISQVVPAGFVYSNITCPGNPESGTTWLVVIDATITNDMVIEQTCNVSLKTVSRGDVILRDKILDLTLAPGESYQYHHDCRVSEQAAPRAYRFYFEDSNGGGGTHPNCDCYIG